MKLNIHQLATRDQLDILAGDVGATKTNLALYHWNGTGLTEKRAAGFKTNKFHDIHSLIAAFMEKEKMPDRVCLGVAGPVKDGKVMLTNNGWELRESDISNHNNHVAVTLVNDLEATAYGLAVKEDKTIHVLHEGMPDPHGNMAIISPGTGLGEAGPEAAALGVTVAGACSSPRSAADSDSVGIIVERSQSVGERNVKRDSLSGICQAMTQRGSIQVARVDAKVDEGGVAFDLLGDGAGEGVETRRRAGLDALVGREKQAAQLDLHHRRTRPDPRPLRQALLHGQSRGHEG